MWTSSPLVHSIFLTVVLLEALQRRWTHNTIHFGLATGQRTRERDIYIYIYNTHIGLGRAAELLGRLDLFVDS